MGTTLSLVQLAHAQAPLGVAPAPRRAVAVTVVGATEEARVLEDTIRELLARLQLTMVDHGTSRALLLATVEVEIAPSGTAHVVVRSAGGATVLDRNLPRDANAAIQREQIAHAVRGAAEAELLTDEDRVAGRAPPIPPEDAAPTTEPEPPPTPAAVSEPPPAPDVTTPPPVVAAERDHLPATTEGSSLAIDLATFAGVGIVGSGAAPVARVGGSVTLASRRGLRPSLAISGTYAFPFTSGSDTIESRAHLVSARAIPALELLHGSWFALDVGAGGGVEVLSVEPSSATLPISALRATTTRVAPILSASLTARVALASDVVLTLGLVSDVDPATRRYVFEDREQQTTILSPWTIRPMLLAGLSFTAFGETPFYQGRGTP